MRDRRSSATRRVLSFAGLLPLLAFTLPAVAQDSTASRGSAMVEEKAAAQVAAAAPDLAYVRMSTTLGDMLIELDRAKAPATVDNFLAYVDQGFYSGTIFHRVMNDFMVQGGGFTADYEQKPAQPPIQNEAANGLKNDYGTIAMARTNEPNSATCQFFINTVDNTRLDYSAPTPAGWGYCVFGRVIEGFETLEAIRAVPVHSELKVFNQPAPDVPVVIQGCARVDAASCSGAVAHAGEAKAAVQAAIKARTAEQAVALVGSGIALVESKGGDTSRGVVSSTGLWVLDTVVGTGAQPTPTQTVTVHYTGWLTDGTQFDSSRERGEPAEFSLTRVIAGWTEGVGGMKVGGKRYLVVPQQLGWGEAGNGAAIPPRATTVFEVELLGIK